MEVVQQGLNAPLRLGVPGQNQPAIIHHRYPDFHHLDRRQLFQHRRRCQPRRVNHQAVFQGDLQTVGQESDQDMGIGAMLELMMDGPDASSLFRERNALSIWVSCT